MQLHHLALGAKDVEKVAEFYRVFFKLPETRRHTDEHGLRSIWLKLESGVVMVERIDEPRQSNARMRPGLFLIAFQCTKEERDALERVLTANGHPIEERTDFTSYVRDPEGNRVALSNYALSSNEP